MFAKSVVSMTKKEQLSETDYTDIPQMRIEWDRRIEEENRKKE